MTEKQKPFVRSFTATITYSITERTAEDFRDAESMDSEFFYFILGHDARIGDVTIVEEEESLVESSDDDDDGIQTVN